MQSGGAVVKNPSAKQETQEMWVQSLGWEDSLVKEMEYNPLVFLPGKFMDKGTWPVMVHRITESDMAE